MTLPLPPLLLTGRHRRERRRKGEGDTELRERGARTHICRSLWFERATEEREEEKRGGSRTDLFRVPRINTDGGSENQQIFQKKAPWLCDIKTYRKQNLLSDPVRISTDFEGKEEKERNARTHIYVTCHGFNSIWPCTDMLYWATKEREEKERGCLNPCIQEPATWPGPYFYGLCWKREREEEREGVSNLPF